MEMANDIKLYERMATVEAGMKDMKEGISDLNVTIKNLNDKIDAATSKISTAAGIFAAVVFFCEFVIIPVIFIVFKTHVS